MTEETKAGTMESGTAAPAAAAVQDVPIAEAPRAAVPASASAAVGPKTARHSTNNKNMASKVCCYSLLVVDFDRKLVVRIVNQVIVFFGGKVGGKFVRDSRDRAKPYNV